MIHRNVGALTSDAITFYDSAFQFYAYFGEFLLMPPAHPSCTARDGKGDLPGARTFQSGEVIQHMRLGEGRAPACMRAPHL